MPQKSSNGVCKLCIVYEWSETLNSLPKETYFFSLLTNYARIPSSKGKKI